ncbi:S8 family serine peptidase [Gluconacetobacter sp. Hr-1-5]|uniref:subtilisin-like serine protease QhpE n=1 Tax=Gluconacetobacter sp. Hr-1-5 TaxID=3395370 RepID=UPI003B518A19
MTIFPDIPDDRLDALPDLFPGRNGAGVRIAVIDSGVQPEHPHIDRERIEPGVAILSDGSIGRTGPVPDRLGHGTAVLAAIQEKAPRATFVPVQVFHDALRTSAKALVTAIRWAVARDVDLINLSLGSTNAAHLALFTEAVEEAGRRGVSVVAARETGEVPCYPGTIPTVIGVGLDWDVPRSRYRAARCGGQFVMISSGYPRPIPGVPRRRNLYGISFAVAQATGFAALAIQECRSRGAAGCDTGLAMRYRPGHADLARCLEAPPGGAG